MPGVAQLGAPPHRGPGDRAGRAATQMAMRPLDRPRERWRPRSLTYLPLYCGMSAAKAALMARM